MTDEKPPRKPGRPRGRPPGWTKAGEAKTKPLTLVLTPTAYEWVKQQPRGSIAAMLERMANDARL